MNLFLDRSRISLWPAAIFLLILPFTHTVALRLTTLAIAGMLVALSWRSRATPPLPIKLPLFIWAAMAFLSLSWALDPGYTLGEIKNEIAYTMICFLTFYGMTQGEWEWRLWNRVLLSGFLIISALALSARWMVGEWVTEGPHGGVGDYSTYLILIAPFILLAALQNKEARFFHPAWLLLPILLAGGQLTLNRTFWPALLAVGVTFLLLHHFRARPFRMGRHVFGLTLLLGMLTIAPFVEVVKDKTLTQGTNVEIVVQAIRQDPRIPLWSFVLDTIREHPFTGTGFGRGAYRRELTEHFGNGQLWHAHNLFLNYALQMGMGGVLALTLLFGSLAREFWLLYRSGEETARLIGIAGLALLSGVIVKNMTDDFFVRHLSLLFWALVGMSLGYGRRLLARSSVEQAR